MSAALLMAVAIINQHSAHSDLAHHVDLCYDDNPDVETLFIDEPTTTECHDEIDTLNRNTEYTEEDKSRKPLNLEVMLMLFMLLTLLFVVCVDCKHWEPKLRECMSPVDNYIDEKIRQAKPIIIQNIYDPGDMRTLTLYSPSKENTMQTMQFYLTLIYYKSLEIFKY